MIRRPPRSTPTDTLFPYTTLFRSQHRSGLADEVVVGERRDDGELVVAVVLAHALVGEAAHCRVVAPLQSLEVGLALQRARRVAIVGRSEERRGGKECVSTWRCRWEQTH